MGGILVPRALQQIVEATDDAVCERSPGGPAAPAIDEHRGHAGRPSGAEVHLEVDDPVAP